MKKPLPKHIHPSRVIRPGWRISPSDLLAKGKAKPLPCIVRKVSPPYLSVQLGNGEIVTIHAKTIGYHVSKSGIVYY